MPLALPLPEQPKPLAVPAQQRRRLDDHQNLTPCARDLRQEQKMQAIGWAQLGSSCLTVE